MLGVAPARSMLLQVLGGPFPSAGYAQLAGNTGHEAPFAAVQTDCGPR